MKLFIVLVVLCAAVNAKSDDPAKDKVREFAEECKKDTGVSDEAVESILGHHSSTNLKEKCLRACVFKKMELMTDAGKLNKEGAYALVKAMSKGDAAREKLGIAVVDTCAVLKLNDDHCEASEQLHDCFTKEAKATGWGDLESA